MIGRIFNNRYKITERIGIGGMAEVYRAQDTVLGPHGRGQSDAAAVCC